jgi:putative transposase
MPAFDYQGPYAYHVILLTQGRAPYFRDVSLGRRCIVSLKSAAEENHFSVLAFCFMPDHLHGLVLGRGDAANLVTFIQRFKQRTAFQFKRAAGRRLWQQSFYDRLLRGEDDLVQVAEYIFGNPVTSGLAANETEYPLSGGEYFEADEAEASSLLASSAAGASRA